MELNFLKKQEVNTKTKKISLIKWLIIYLIISIIFLLAMPSMISSDEEGNLVTNYKSIRVENDESVGNTEEIQNLNTDLINHKKVKICVLAVENFITNDPYLEAARVFYTYDKFDKDTIFMYVSLKDKKVIIRAGENASKVFSKDIYNTCENISYDYFKEEKYNEGISEMIKYLLKQDGNNLNTSESTKTYFNKIFNVSSVVYALGVSFFLTVIIFITTIIMKKLLPKEEK